MNEEYVELTYVGGLQLEQVMIKKSMISCIQKPKADTFGCIIQVMTEKYPVKESYESVCKMIGAKEI